MTESYQTRVLILPASEELDDQNKELSQYSNNFNLNCLQGFCMLGSVNGTWKFAFANIDSGKLAIENFKKLTAWFFGMLHPASIHYFQFQDTSCYFKVQPSVPVQSDPYTQFLVNLEMNKDSAACTSQPVSTIEEFAKSPLTPLILAPVLIELSDHELLISIGRDNAWVKYPIAVLPPMRTVASFASDTYYHKELVDSRAQLFTCINRTFQDEEEPALVTLWKLCDHPWVRDTLINGGTLELKLDSFGYSYPLLRFHHSCNENEPAKTMDNWRYELLVNKKLMGCGEAFVKRKELAYQLSKNILPGVKCVTHDDAIQAPVCWKIDWESFNQADAAGRADTTFQSIVVQYFQDNTNELLAEHVINPAGIDSSLAKKRFLHGFCRCPFPDPTGHKPGGLWGRVMSNILENISLKKINWMEMLQARNNEDHLTIFCNKASVVYAPDLDQMYKREYQLLAPIGTRFVEKGILKQAKLGAFWLA